MTRFRRGLRSQLQDAKAGNAFVDAMYGDGRPPQVTYPAPKPKRERAPTVMDVTAPPLERDVLKAVWKLLAHHPKVAWITRINSGSLMADFGAGGIHPMRLNYKRGISDLIGQMTIAYGGKFLACEVKRPGGILLPHQRAFLDEVNAAGGVAFVAHSIDDVERAMRDV